MALVLFREFKVGDKVFIHHRDPDNKTGSQDWRKPNGDAGKFGEIVSTSNYGKRRYRVDNTLNNHYYGLFSDDELRHADVVLGEKPDKEPMPDLHVGQWVQAVGQTYGWGAVKYGDIGRVVSVSSGSERYYVDFPGKHPNWIGKRQCFKIVSEPDQQPEQPEPEFEMVINEDRTHGYTKVKKTEQLDKETEKMSEMKKLYRQKVENHLFEAGAILKPYGSETYEPVEQLWDTKETADLRKRGVDMRIRREYVENRTDLFEEIYESQLGKVKYLTKDAAKAAYAALFSPAKKPTTPKK